MQNLKKYFISAFIFTSVFAHTAPYIFEEDINEKIVTDALSSIDERCNTQLDLRSHFPKHLCQKNSPWCMIYSMNALLREHAVLNGQKLEKEEQLSSFDMNMQMNYNTLALRNGNIGLGNQAFWNKESGFESQKVFGIFSKGVKIKDERDLPFDEELFDFNPFSEFTDRLQKAKISSKNKIVTTQKYKIDLADAKEFDPIQNPFIPQKALKANYTPGFKDIDVPSYNYNYLNYGVADLSEGLNTIMDILATGRSVQLSYCHNHYENKNYVKLYEDGKTDASNCAAHSVVIVGTYKDPNLKTCNFILNDSNHNPQEGQDSFTYQTIKSMLSKLLPAVNTDGNKIQVQRVLQIASLKNTKELPLEDPANIKLGVYTHSLLQKEFSSFSTYRAFNGSFFIGKLKYNPGASGILENGIIFSKIGMVPTTKENVYTKIASGTFGENNQIYNGFNTPGGTALTQQGAPSKIEIIRDAKVIDTVEIGSQ